MSYENHIRSYMRLILNNSSDVDDEFYGVFYKPHMSNESNWMKLVPHVSGIVQECWDESEATTRAELINLFNTPFARFVHKNKVPKIINFILNRLHDVHESYSNRSTSSDDSSSAEEPWRYQNAMQGRLAERMERYQKVLL